MLLLLQRSISDYFYSLAKKDRNVKTLFSIFSKTEKGFLKTSVETKPFLFPYILSITNWKRNVKRFLFNWNYAGKSLPGFLSTYIRIAKIRTRNQAPKRGLWYLYITIYKKKARAKRRKPSLFCCTRFVFSGPV